MLYHHDGKLVYKVKKISECKELQKLVEKQMNRDIPDLLVPNGCVRNAFLLSSNPAIGYAEGFLAYDTGKLATSGNSDLLHRFALHAWNTFEDFAFDLTAETFFPDENYLYNEFAWSNDFLHVSKMTHGAVQMAYYTYLCRKKSPIKYDFKLKSMKEIKEMEKFVMGL